MNAIHISTRVQVLIIFFLAIVQPGCGVSTNTDHKAFENLKVKWELLENRYGKKDTCRAAFTFVNAGTKILEPSNWQLYFNQNTLPVNPSGDTAVGKVEHVNGDLYRFVPGKTFRLLPGDSVIFTYEYDGFLIKERDGPIGAYFVLNPENAAPEIIKVDGDVVVKPFSDLQKLFGKADIVATVPTAASVYAANQNIPVLPLDQVPTVLPTPYQQTQGSGAVTLDKNAVIYYTAGLQSEATFLSESLKKLLGASVKTSEGRGGKNAISLAMEPLSVNGVSAEAYKLTTSADNEIEITGSDSAGVFYGIQTLLSLINASKQPGVQNISIANVEIMDAPRFGYRGLLLDVARNFREKKDMLRLIDLLAMYKINILNIRISDDEGWRIEIAGLPELTEVGAKRGHTSDSRKWLPPSFGSGSDPLAQNNHGTGFFTREDFKEIIRYAHERHVTVVPEVCFPSHARAAIKAMEVRYEAYTAKGDAAKANEFRLIDPADQSQYLSAQMYKDNIVCVALPSVYHFYETVVKDFIAMYNEAGLKLSVFNTGGDEVPAGAWSQSPLCIALMKQQDIKNPMQLQGYFLEKALAIFEKYQLKVTGWEEIVLNKGGETVAVNNKFLGRNVLPLVWDNTGANIDLGYRIANAGYPVVLCNVTNLYFDLAYNTDPAESGLYWGGFQDAIDPYIMTPMNVYHSADFDAYGRFSTVAETFAGKQRLQKPENIVGLQAQLWSETLKGPATMEYMLVPKIFAFAEKAWAKAPEWENEANAVKRRAAIHQGWAVLANTIGQREFPRLDAFFDAYHYRIAPPGAVMENGELKANSSFPGSIIRFTTDGTEPGLQSQVYSGPVKVNGKIMVRAFNAVGRGSRSLGVQ